MPVLAFLMRLSLRCPSSFSFGCEGVGKDSPELSATTRFLLAYLSPGFLFGAIELFTRKWSDY